MATKAVQEQVTNLQEELNETKGAIRQINVSQTTMMEQISAMMNALTKLTESKENQEKKESTIKNEPNSDDIQVKPTDFVPISKKFTEASVKSAGVMPKLKEENGRLINGELFRQKFGDYLDALGLKEALDDLQTSCIDLTGDELLEQQILNQTKIKLLTQEEEHAERWKRAFVHLKGNLDGNLYLSLVTRAGKAKPQNFFTLWKRVNQLIGGVGSKLELEHLTKRWEELKLNDGDRLSELLIQIDEISNTVKSISEDTEYSNTTKNQKLISILRNTERFKTPIDKMTGKIITKEWEYTKLLFMSFAPRTPEGEELPCKREELPYKTDEEDTGVAGAAQKAPRSRPSEEKRCEFCNRTGHTVEECRTKTFHGTRFPNNDCRQWVNEGRCNWENNPKNLRGDKCKFQHNPLKRGTRNWTQAPRRNTSSSNMTNSDTNVTNFQETLTKHLQEQNNQMKQMQQFMANMFSQRQTQETGKLQSHHSEVSNNPDILVGWSDDNTTLKGWSGYYEVLSTEEEEEDEEDEVKHEETKIVETGKSL